MGILSPTSRGETSLTTGEQTGSPSRIKLRGARDLQCFRRLEALSEFSLSNCLLRKVSNLFARLDFKSLVDNKSHMQVQYSVWTS